MSKSKGVVSLNTVGQSVWYDNLSKAVLQSGKLASLIEAGVSGLTSNPSIFKKAIADSNDYDQDLKAYKTLDAEAACEKLMLKDVTAAADLLLPVFRETNGADGHTSVEVSPTLAHDTQGTISAAKRIWNEVSRPNLMIKIPATKEGIPAIQKVLEEGINVNVTLIFSVEVYCQVAEAYLKALEFRTAQNLPVEQISSVASFFVSRVDASVEKKFSELVKAGKVQATELERFIGKVGIDNSRLAYKAFLDYFESNRFSALAQKGARVQRPLWASTGTKNPDFDPLLYVKTLAVPSTVNTLPPDTLEKVLLENVFKSEIAEISKAGNYVELIKSYGIDFKACLEELEVAGVKSFAEAYQELVDSVAAKQKLV